MLKKWVLAASLVGATAVAGAGITFALFTATAKTGPQDFFAGTLQLDGIRDQGDTIYGPMFYINGDDDGLSDIGDPGLYPTGLWAPGDSHHRVFQIQNVGTLDAKLVSFEADLQQGSRELAEVLDVAVYDGPYKTTAGNLISPTPPVLYQGKLADLIDNGFAIAPGHVLQPWDLANFGIDVSFPLNAGNEYQNTTLIVRFSVNAEQAKNNP